MLPRLPKFKRSPERLTSRQMTASSVAIIDLIASYQFLSTSLLVRLAPCSKNITHRHLQLLFHRGLVNRFSFPRIGNPGEFYYYLDSRDALPIIGRADDRELAAVISRNRAKRYADVHDLSLADEMQGRLLFLKHETMISRFHAFLDLASRRSSGRVVLERFRQGSSLWHHVDVPAVDRNGSGAGLPERKAFRPDAFFTLRFMSEQRESRAHFFYEADRETESTSRLTDKLRVYHWYLVRARHQEARFGIRRVRAVLVETLRPEWSSRLRHTAEQPAVTGGQASSLFWFTSSDRLASLDEAESAFGSIWSSANRDRMWSLLD